MSSGKYSPMIGINKVIWGAFCFATLFYAIIAFMIVKERGDDMFVFYVPEKIQLMFYLLSAMAVIVIVIGFYIRSNLPTMFLRSQHGPIIPQGMGTDIKNAIDQADPELKSIAAKAQTVAIIVFAFLEATAVFGILLVLLGCSYITMIPYVAVSLLSLLAARPTEEFYDRVGQRLLEMKM